MGFVMNICFELSREIEQRLESAQESVDLSQDAKEAYLVDLYRRRKITHHQLGRALELDRYDTDRLLKRHGVELELSLEEFNAEAASLREARP
jgi:predicted HTH domain antitoxin